MPFTYFEFCGKLLMRPRHSWLIEDWDSIIIDYEECVEAGVSNLTTVNDYVYGAGGRIWD